LPALMLRRKSSGVQVQMFASPDPRTLYEHAEKVLGSGDAYICTCTPDDFRLNINAGRACPDRSKSPEQNLADWAKMLNGGFGEGDAVLRVKTELAHPNPAVRDWPALRI